MEDITLIKQFLPNPDVFYGSVERSIGKWHKELKVVATGVMKKINRSMCYLSEPVTTYRYAGFEFPGEGWNDTCLIMRKMVQDHVKLPFNSVLLNKYKDGRDEIKWHADKEKTLGPVPVIACINLGATRKFWFMNLETKEKFFHEVKSGDLLVMGPECQRKYLHAILKEKDVSESRISLTFRYNFQGEQGEDTPD